MQTSQPETPILVRLTASENNRSFHCLHRSLTNRFSVCIQKHAACNQTARHLYIQRPHLLWCHLVDVLNSNGLGSLNPEDQTSPFVFAFLRRNRIIKYLESAVLVSRSPCNITVASVKPHSSFNLYARKRLPVMVFDNSGNVKG